MDNQKELKIEYRDISTLVPFKRNPKQHPEVQVANIARSIEKFGWRNPVLINAETGEIVAGHGRILAAKKLGITSIPTIDASDMTDEQIDQYRYLDNKLAESPWDVDVLAEDLQNLDFTDFDLEWDCLGDLTEEEEPVIDRENGEKKGSLAENFGIPPFSVIYTTKGGWAARKRAWVEKGIRSELGRGGKLTYQIDRRDYAKSYSDGLIEYREKIRRC